MDRAEDIFPATLFSPDRRYRYLLTRRVSLFSDRSVLFVMLNPSRADELRNDNTVSNVIRITNRRDYGWLVVSNLSPLRATNPRALLTAGDEPEDVAQTNLLVIKEVAAIVDTVVVARGADGVAEERAGRALNALSEVVSDLYCLGATKDGQPRRPLYLQENVRIRPYYPELMAG